MTSEQTPPVAAESDGIDSGYRPARRRTQRLLMPSLLVLIEGRAYVTVDWSLGGLQVESYSGALKRGDYFPINSVAPADGTPPANTRLMPVGIRARAMRREGEYLAAEFVELDGRAFDALEALMRQRREYLASLAATARAVA